MCTLGHSASPFPTTPARLRASELVISFGICIEYGFEMPASTSAWFAIP